MSSHRHPFRRSASVVEPGSSLAGTSTGSDSFTSGRNNSARLTGLHHRGNGDTRGGKATHAQDVVTVIVAVVTGVAQLDGVGAGLREAVLEAAVEVQAGVVVALGDDAALRVADDDQWIDLLAEAIADRLETDALCRP